MSSILYDKRGARERVTSELGLDFQRQAIAAAQDTIGSKRAAQVASVDAWEKYRQKAAGIRNQVLNNLDYYVGQFVERAREAGAEVSFAATAQQACDQAVGFMSAAGVELAVKGKSMVAEEVGLNAALEAAGVRVIETDAAEHMLQLSGEAPSHIVVPAIHNDRGSIQRLYRDKLGYPGSDDPQEILLFLRNLLRPEFLRAQAGITGCNFAIAETGTCTLVTNEGNGRMCASVPENQLVLVGVERILPDLRSLDVLMKLLVRSAVGAKITCGVTLNTGTRRPGEADGPARVRIILVDNGRTRALASADFRPMLRCIRCGACMNACPVYRHITGHGYGSIYPGPMGVVLTPLLTGYEASGELSELCTQCGACTNVCPVMIPLADSILRHRVRRFEGLDAVDADVAAAVERLDEVPARLSRALGRDAAPEAPSKFDTVAGPQRAEAEAAAEGEDACERLLEECEALGTCTERVASDADVPAAVARLVERLSAPGKGAGASGQPIEGAVALPGDTGDERVAGLSAAIASTLAGIGREVVRWDADAPETSRAAVEAAGVGVTFAEAAVAETGTVAQPCSAQSGRALSLLPAAHIAVVRARDVVVRLTQLADALERRVADGRGLPSQLALISGPSNTADIELVRVLGVHGPVRCAVVLVDD